MRFVRALITIFLPLMTPSLAFGQVDSFSERPIRLVVATPAGSTPDVAARLIGPYLAEELNQSVVIENRPGVNGILAAREVLGRANDGYTLLLAPSSTMAVNPNVYVKQAQTFLTDFTAVSQLYRTDFSLIVSAKSGLRSVTDILATAKRRPGKLVAAFASIGSASHVAIELFKQMANVDIYAVPFNGSPAAALGVASGDADLLFETIPATEPVVNAGKVTRVAMTGNERFPLASSIPTVIESGVPGYAITTWAGLFVAKGVPPERVQRISLAIAKISKNQMVVDKLATAGFLPGEASSSKFQALWLQESDIWKKVVAGAPSLQLER